MVKDQIGHFLKPLNVLGITPNLMVDYCNLPFILFLRIKDYIWGLRFVGDIFLYNWHIL